VIQQVADCWTIIEDSDEDDGKPAAKPAAKKGRAVQSSDSASVLLERPSDSGPPIPEGPVPPVAAMPPEAARAAAPKRGHPVGSGNKRMPQKGQKRQGKGEAVTRRVMKRSPTFLRSAWSNAWSNVIQPVWSFCHMCTHLSLSRRYTIVCKRGTWIV